MYKEKIIDAITGEEFWRDYTPEEIAEAEKSEIETAQKIQELVQASAAKAALLEKLGITEEEAKLLLS